MVRDFDSLKSGVSFEFGMSDTPLMGVSMQLEFPNQFLEGTPVFGTPADLSSRPRSAGFEFQSDIPR
jgi:hypothetical protein